MSAVDKGFVFTDTDKSETHSYTLRRIIRKNEDGSGSFFSEGCSSKFFRLLGLRFSSATTQLCAPHTLKAATDVCK